MAKESLLELAMQQTKANTVKARGGSGRTTYLDRIVSVLLNEDGQPAEPKERVEVICEVSLAIAQEQIEGLDLKNEEHKAEFKKINNKVKPMVNAAVSDSQNSTALSFNEKYKDVWVVVKEGKMISLQAKS